MRTGVVVLGHGSNSSADEGNQMILSLAEMIGKLAGVEFLETAFLNPRSQRQDLGEAVQKLVACGVQRIIVAPVFLSRGQHIQKDIPEIIESLKKEHKKQSNLEILLTDCLGPDYRIAEMIAEKIQRAAGDGSFLAHPGEIEAKSRKIAEQWVDNFPWPEREVVRRMVHAAGDLGIAKAAEVHPQAVESAFKVFSRGGNVIADVKMVRAGINPLLQSSLGIKVLCAIDDAAVFEEAKKESCTRAMAAMRHLAEALGGSLVVVGNAPTALFEVLRMVRENLAKPALIIGVPVGFVGAAEAKMALVSSGIPYITVHGSRGGSTLAVAAVNALFELYAEQSGLSVGLNVRHS